MVSLHLLKAQVSNTTSGQYRMLIFLRLTKPVSHVSVPSMTTLVLSGAFVATYSAIIFTSNAVLFIFFLFFLQTSTAETITYIKVVIPLSLALMIPYRLWPWKAPVWPRARWRTRDLEAGTWLGSLRALIQLVNHINGYRFYLGQLTSPAYLQANK